MFYFIPFIPNSQPHIVGNKDINVNFYLCQKISNTEFSFQNVCIKFDGACSSSRFISSCRRLRTSECRFTACNWNSPRYFSIYRQLFPTETYLNIHFVGSVDKGVVEVTNCFCVPHKEHDDQVEAELSYALDVYELNKRVNSAEIIVGEFIRTFPYIIKSHLQYVIGWWATGHEVTNHSSVIHEYYARECNNPVHLTVDTSLQGNRMGLKAYVCVNLGIPGGKSGCMFTPINSEVTCYEPEVLIHAIQTRSFLELGHSFRL